MAEAEDLEAYGSLLLDSIACGNGGGAALGVEEIPGVEVRKSDARGGGLYRVQQEQPSN